MTDCALKNGQPARDGSGRRIVLRGRDALIQRARISLTARKGGFVYNRELGSGLAASEELSVPSAQVLAEEALARFGNTSVRVLGISEGALTVRLTAEGEAVEEEVSLNGTL